MGVGLGFGGGGGGGGGGLEVVVDGEFASGSSEFNWPTASRWLFEVVLVRFIRIARRPLRQAGRSNLNGIATERWSLSCSRPQIMVFL